MGNYGQSNKSIIEIAKKITEKSKYESLNSCVNEKNKNIVAKKDEQSGPVKT